jgi:hypothetical protein
LEETVGKDTGESGGHATNEVENGISFLQLVTWVPAAKQVRTAREETGLEDTEDDTEADHLGPGLKKAETDLFEGKLGGMVRNRWVRLTIVTPHRRVMVGRNARGPSLRRTTVASG